MAKDNGTFDAPNDITYFGDPPNKEPEGHLESVTSRPATERQSPAGYFDLDDFEDEVSTKEVSVSDETVSSQETEIPDAAKSLYEPRQEQTQQPFSPATDAPKPNVPKIETQTSVAPKAQDSFALITQELENDFARLQQLRAQFLDPTFIERAKTVHATTPNFMDPEFIEAFNSFCLIDELYVEKLNHLEVNLELVNQEYGVRDEYNRLLHNQRLEYHSTREAFQRDLDILLNKVSHSNPAFITYMHNLKPTFDLPNIDAFKEKVSKDLKSKMVPAQSSSPIMDPTETVSSISWKDRWRAASLKTKALIIGALTMLPILGGGAVAIALTRGADEESKVKDNQPAQDANEPTSSTTSLRNEPIRTQQPLGEAKRTNAATRPNVTPSTTSTTMAPATTASAPTSSAPAPTSSNVPGVANAQEFPPQVENSGSSLGIGFTG